MKDGRSHRTECEPAPTLARPPEPAGVPRRGLETVASSILQDGAACDEHHGPIAESRHAAHAADSARGGDDAPARAVPVLEHKPAAQMSLAEMAAIEPRLSVAFGFGSGLETTPQPVPFQCSISALGQHLLLGFPIPTAQTSDGESAVTPKNDLKPCGGSGRTTRLQFVPSKWRVSAPEPPLPTAHMSLLESAEIP